MYLLTKFMYFITRDGVFDEAPVTTWKRNRPQFVYWASGANHWGGYAFRLCKITSSGISGVTEKCFQRGHLKFHGRYTWLYDRPTWRRFDSRKWMQKTARRRTRNTYPPGSMWTEVKPPRRSFWAFRDLVFVPGNLPCGEYILSFRWDCQRTPQIWSSCSLIRIVE